MLTHILNTIFSIKMETKSPKNKPLSNPEYYRDAKGFFLHLILVTIQS